MATPELNEPKCVQWKRRGQRAIRKRLAGMTPAQELAYWNESYQKLLRLHAASKKRLQEKQAAANSPAKRETTVMPEPKCVQWKRQAQARIRKEIAGMTREEELAYWDKAHQDLLRTHAESKRRLEEKKRSDKHSKVSAGE